VRIAHRSWLLSLCVIGRVLSRKHTFLDKPRQGWYFALKVEASIMKIGILIFTFLLAFSSYGAEKMVAPTVVKPTPPVIWK
jgi:hypothetical protein